MKPRAEAFLGIDIGGQSVRGIRIEEDGQTSQRTRVDTPAGGGAAAVLSSVREVIDRLLEGGPAATIGAGSPGAVDGEGRIAGEVVNIPGWRGLDLRATLEEVSGAPARVRNDANAAAFAEWALRGASSRALLFVGLGTGIGGGFVQDGEILSGVDDRAGEIGHVVVRPGGRLCGCGVRGCVEAYAAGPALGRMAVELAASGAWDGSALALAARRGGVDARSVYRAYAEGDSLARAVHQEAAEALATAVGVGLSFLAPDTVVFGGGVLEGARDLVRDVAAAVPRYVYRTAHEHCRFELARWGADAGLYGAALLGALSRLGREGTVALACRAAAFTEKC